MEILHVLSPQVEQDLRGNYVLRCHIIQDLTFDNFEMAESVLKRSREQSSKFTIDEITSERPGEYDG